MAVSITKELRKRYFIIKKTKFQVTIDSGDLLQVLQGSLAPLQVELVLFKSCVCMQFIRRGFFKSFSIQVGLFANSTDPILKIVSVNYGYKLLFSLTNGIYSSTTDTILLGS